MGGYRVVVAPAPAEVIRGLPPEVKHSIRNALRALGDHPELGLPLRGELAGLWRYRVRRFRIVYRLERGKRTVRVMAVGHRVRIYDTIAEVGRRRRSDE
jgi:mRNA interferase RelE/StbE